MNIAETVYCTIKPYPNRPGFMLESREIGFPMWYLKLENAIYQAKYRGGPDGRPVIIEIFNNAGVVVQRIDPTGRGAPLSAIRSTVNQQTPGTSAPAIG